MWVCVCARVCAIMCVDEYAFACIYMHTISKTVDVYDIIQIRDDVITTTTGGHSYLIKKLIVSGAFANIYLATDIHSGDKKALKVSE